MSCKKVNGLINSLIEANITAAEEAEIKTHAQTCEKCALEYKAALALKSVFLEMKEEPKLPADFNLKVWDKIGEQSPSMIDRVMNYIKRPVFVVPAAAFAAAVLFGLFVMNPAVVQDKKVEFASAEPAVKTVEKQQITKTKKAVTYITQKQAEGETRIVSAETVKEDIIKEETKDIPQVNQVAQVKPALDEKLPPALKGNGDTSSAAPVIAAAADKKVIVTPTPAEIEVRNNVINAVKGEKFVIKYRLDDLGQVEIRIYDRTGQPVVHFYEKKPAGAYEFTWDGKDDSGRAAASGIYTVYIKTPLVEKKIKAAVIR